MQPVARYNSCSVSSASPDIMEQRSGSEATASPSSSTMTAAARLQAARQRLAARTATTTTSACSTSSRTTTTSADAAKRPNTMQRCIEMIQEIRALARDALQDHVGDASARSRSRSREPRRDPAGHGDSTAEPLAGSHHSSAVLHGLPCSLECGAPKEMAIEDSLPAATPSSFALSNAMWTSNEASDEAPAPPPPPADCHRVESQDSLSAIPAEEESEEESEDDLRKNNFVKADKAFILNLKAKSLPKAKPSVRKGKLVQNWAKGWPSHLSWMRSDANDFIPIKKRKQP